MSKIAIIGASIGQLPLCKKAKEMGLETICFAWDENAICKDYVDKFYPVSVLEKELIVEICKKEGVDGVVSNASDLLAKITAELSQELNLIGNSVECISQILDKYQIRKLTEDLGVFKAIQYVEYNGNIPNFFPCVAKPTTGSSKSGVQFIKSKDEFNDAITYTKNVSENIIIEEYIPGREISVECLSFCKHHNVIQITDKVSSGPPHFVELAHHQPANLDYSIITKIHSIIPQLLDYLGFENGASHIELKIDEHKNIYLIEVNPRGAGGEISSQLVFLSTGYDYLKAMIDVALGNFTSPHIKCECYSGIYFLCDQTKYLINFFREADSKTWCVEKRIKSYNLQSATSNYNRNGFVVYKSNHKINIDE